MPSFCLLTIYLIAPIVNWLDPVREEAVREHAAEKGRPQEKDSEMQSRKNMKVRNEALNTCAENVSMARSALTGCLCDFINKVLLSGSPQAVAGRESCPGPW